MWHTTKVEAVEREVKQRVEAVELQVKQLEQDIGWHEEEIRKLEDFQRLVNDDVPAGKKLKKTPVEEAPAAEGTGTGTGSASLTAEAGGPTHRSAATPVDSEEEGLIDDDDEYDACVSERDSLGEGDCDVDDDVEAQPRRAYSGRKPSSGFWGVYECTGKWNGKSYVLL